MIRPFSHFYRNTRAGELLELFLVSAVSSVLLTRAWLQLTGYPTIGGHNLHIAHMLWGGLLMTVAIIILLAFMGVRTQRRASVIAGLGFGLFIDELGKFITRDNNYFYRPTVALIYLTFVILFIVSRYLSQTRQLSQKEYLLNALSLAQEVVVHDLDKTERNQALMYVAQADPKHPLVKPLTQVLQQTPSTAPTRSRWHRWAHDTQSLYERIIARPKGSKIFNWIFMTYAFLFFGFVVYFFMQRLADNIIDFGSCLELLSAAIPPCIIFVASIVWRKNRLRRYRLFSVALLMSIFVTQFFSFYHDQFNALPGCLITVIFYMGVRSLIKHEQQLQSASRA
jgi:multisubunit Na+/H+ antiporter MnhC subunit